MKLNSKGFTLIEVLAVIVIIGLLAGVSIPTVLKSINSGKESAYKVMVSNIVIASKELFEELSYSEGVVDIYKYDDLGNLSGELVGFEPDGSIEVNLQTLVSNGYLTGTSSEGKTSKVIVDPRNNEDIGYCMITIIRVIDENTKITYTVKSNDESGCPSNDDYQNGVK